MDSLLEKALGWYTSGDSGKKEAALELFPKEKLQDEITKYNEKKTKEGLERREEQLKENLKRCKKLFPIGTPIWSDDGTDHCPNIVISEPYIAETKYRMPYDAYPMGYNGTRKTIFANTIRMSTCANEPLEGKWGKGKVNLEICLQNMDSTSEWGHRNHIINLKEYYKVRNDEKTDRMKWLKDEIERRQKSLDELTSEYKTLEKYEPTEFTKELINKIVEDYA